MCTLFYLEGIWPPLDEGRPGGAVDDAVGVGHGEEVDALVGGEGRRLLQTMAQRAINHWRMAMSSLKEEDDEKAQKGNINTRHYTQNYYAAQKGDSLHGYCYAYVTLIRLEWRVSDHK